MATAAPTIRPPVTFPTRLAWLQQNVRTHVRPYHLVVTVAAVLVTVGFVAVVGVLLLIATNFNLLGAIE